MVNLNFRGMSTRKSALVQRFLTVANEAIKNLNSGHRNYFDYAHTTVDEFFRQAAIANEAEIRDAIKCIEEKRWIGFPTIIRVLD